MKIQIAFAERCAWRAVYVSRVLPAEPSGYVPKTQFFHLGVDPNTLDVRGPRCFGGISIGRFYWSWNFRLPHVRWKYPASPLRRWSYRHSSRFWHSLDGRFKD